MVFFSGRPRAMSVRFTKRKKVAPGTSATISKGGASLSTGVRGARVSVGKRGLRSSFGIPGSGLSFSGPRSGGVFGILIGFAVMAVFWVIMMVINLVIAAIPLLWRLLVVMMKALFSVSSWMFKRIGTAIAQRRQVAAVSPRTSTPKLSDSKRNPRAKE